MPFFVSGADGSAISAMVKAASQQRGADPALLSAAAKAKYSNNKIDDLRGLVQAASGFVGGGKTTEELKDEAERVRLSEYLSPEASDTRSILAQLANRNAKKQVAEALREETEKTSRADYTVKPAVSIDVRDESIRLLNDPNSNLFESIEAVEAGLPLLHKVDYDQVRPELDKAIASIAVTKDNKKSVEETIGQSLLGNDVTRATRWIKQYINSNGMAGNIYAGHEIKETKNGAEFVIKYNNESTKATSTVNFALNTEQLGRLKEKTSSEKTKINASIRKGFEVKSTISDATMSSFANDVATAGWLEPETFTNLINQFEQSKNKEGAKVLESVENYVLSLEEELTKTEGGFMGFGGKDVRLSAQGTTYKMETEVPQDVQNFYSEYATNINFANNVFLMNNEAQPVPKEMRKMLSQFALQAAANNGRLFNGEDFNEAVYKVAGEMSVPNTQQTINQPEYKTATNPETGARLRSVDGINWEPY